VQNVSLDNVIEGVDNISLKYNHETRNYDYLIGKIVRGKNMFKLGVITKIDYYRDGYDHDNAVAILDSGREVNCRLFVLGS